MHALQGQRVLGQVLHSALRSVVVWLKVLGAALSTIGRHELHYDAPRMRCDDATTDILCPSPRITTRRFGQIRGLFAREPASWLQCCRLVLYQIEVHQMRGNTSRCEPTLQDPWAHIHREETCLGIRRALLVRHRCIHWRRHDRSATPLHVPALSQLHIARKVREEDNVLEIGSRSSFGTRYRWIRAIKTFFRAIRIYRNFAGPYTERYTVGIGLEWRLRQRQDLPQSQELPGIQAVDPRICAAKAIEVDEVLQE